MKTFFFSLLAFLFTAGQVSAAVTVTADSRIRSVTVYQDRAELMREAAMDLEAGEYNFVFDGLPPNAEQDSLRSEGEGKGMILDASLDRVELTQTAEAGRKALETKKTDIEKRLAVVRKRFERLKKEVFFLDSMRGYVTQTGAQEKSMEMDSEKWQKLISYYRTKLESVDAEITDTEGQIRRLESDLDQVRREIASTGSAAVKAQDRAVITLKVREKGRFTVRIFYRVPGPSWEPVYEVRAAPEKNSVSLTFRASVRQATGEDWTGAQLKLSTARPQAAGRPPVLGAWVISEQQTVSYNREARKAMPSSKSMSVRDEEKDDANSGAASEMEYAPASAPAPMLQQNTAEVRQGATAAVYVVQGEVKVPGDNSAVRVTLFETELKAAFSYSSCPSLVPSAYLSVMSTNTTQYTFPAGTSSVFLEGSYVSSVPQDMITPAGPFTAFLGVDDSVTVERRLIRRFIENNGLLDKKRLTRFEYVTKIVNRKKSDITLKLTDRVPVSYHQDIKVKVLDPVIDPKDPKDVTVSNEGIIEWTLKLKAGETREIPLKFTVEHPASMSVNGL
jgi:uncharacterized protein (TIGR02231 family)